jgi:hypothetical protein
MSDPLTRILRVVSRDGTEDIVPIGAFGIPDFQGDLPPLTRSSQLVDFALPHNQKYGSGEWRVNEKTGQPYFVKIDYGIEGDKFDRLVAGLRTQTTRKDNFTGRALGRSGGRIGNPDVRPMRIVTYDNPDLNEGTGQILEVTGVSTLGEKYPALTGRDWSGDIWSDRDGDELKALSDEQKERVKQQATDYARAEGAVRPDGTVVGRYTGDTLGDRRNYFVDGDTRYSKPGYSPYYSDANVIDFKPVGEPFPLSRSPRNILDKIALERRANAESKIVNPDGSIIHTSRQPIDGVVTDSEGNEILYPSLNDAGLESLGIYNKTGGFVSGGERQNGIKYEGIDMPKNPLKFVIPGDEDNYNAALNYPMDGQPGRNIVPVRVGGLRYQLGLADNKPDTNQFSELVKRYAGGDFDPQDLPDFILNAPPGSIPTDGRGKPFHGASNPSMNSLAYRIAEQVKLNRQLREASQAFSESTLFPRNQLETLDGTVAEIDRTQKAYLSSSKNPVDLLQGHAKFYLQDENTKDNFDYEPAMSHEAREILSDNPNYGKTITTGNIPLVDNLYRQELRESRPNGGLGVRGFGSDSRGFYADYFGRFENKRVDENGNLIRTFVQKPLFKTEADRQYVDSRLVGKRFEDENYQPFVTWGMKDGKRVVIDDGSPIGPYLPRAYEPKVNSSSPLNPIDSVITSLPSANLWLDGGNQYPLARTVKWINEYWRPNNPKAAGLDLSRMTEPEKFELDRALGLVTDEPLPIELASLSDPRAVAEGGVSSRPLTDEEIRGRGEGRESDRVYEWSAKAPESQLEQVFLDSMDNPRTGGVRLGEVLGLPFVNPSTRKDGVKYSLSSIIGGGDSSPNTTGNLEDTLSLKGTGYNPENQDLSIFDLPDNVFVLDSPRETPKILSVQGTKSDSYDGARVPGFLNQLRGMRQDPKTGQMTYSDRANIVGVNPPEEVPANADEIVQGMGYENYAHYLNENRFLHPNQNKAKVKVDRKKLFVTDTSYDFNDPLVQDAAFVPFKEIAKNSDGTINDKYLFAPARYSTGEMPEKGLMYPSAEDEFTILDDLLGRTYIEFNGKKYPIEPTPIDPKDPLLEGAMTPTIENAIQEGKRKIAMIKSELGLRRGRSPARIEKELNPKLEPWERPDPSARQQAVGAPIVSNTPLWVDESVTGLAAPSLADLPRLTPEIKNTVYREHFPNTNSGDFNPNRTDFLSSDRVIPNEKEATKPFTFYDDIIPVGELDDTTLNDLIAHYEKEIARAELAREKVYGLQEVDPIDLKVRSVVTPVADRDSFKSVARPSVELTPEEVEELQRPGKERAVSNLSALLEEIKKTRTAPRIPLPAPIPRTERVRVPAPVLAPEREPLPPPTLASIFGNEPVIDVPAVEVPETPVPAAPATPNKSVWFEPVEERKEREEVLNSLLGGSSQFVGATPNTLDELLNQPIISSPVATATRPTPEENIQTLSSPSSPPNAPIENPNGLVRLPDGRVVPRWMIALGLGGVALGGLAVGRELSRDNRDDRSSRVRDWYGY